MRALFIICFFYSGIIMAKDLGVRGSVYPIAEPDLLHGIHHKLHIMQQDGDLEREKKAVIARTVAHVLRPTPVTGVTDLTGTAKSHLFNPTIILNNDITDTEGNIIAKKGTMVNPLEKIHFDEVLFFVNADNSSQMQWLKNKIKTIAKYKIILTSGNINKSSKFLGHKVYFDQHGVLCKKFKIKHTPTEVYQPKYHEFSLPELMVEEVPVA